MDVSLLPANSLWEKNRESPVNSCPPFPILWQLMEALGAEDFNWWGEKKRVDFSQLDISGHHDPFHSPRVKFARLLLSVLYNPRCTWNRWRNKRKRNLHPFIILLFDSQPFSHQSSSDVRWYIYPPFLSLNHWLVMDKHHVFPLPLFTEPDLYLSDHQAAIIIIVVMIYSFSTILSGRGIPEVFYYSSFFFSAFPVTDQSWFAWLKCLFTSSYPLSPFSPSPLNLFILAGKEKVYFVTLFPFRSRHHHHLMSILEKKKKIFYFRPSLPLFHLIWYIHFGLQFCSGGFFVSIPFYRN